MRYVSEKHNGCFGETAYNSETTIYLTSLAYTAVVLCESRPTTAVLGDYIQFVIGIV